MDFDVDEYDPFVQGYSQEFEILYKISHPKDDYYKIKEKLINVILRQLDYESKDKATSYPLDYPPDLERSLLINFFKIIFEKSRYWPKGSKVRLQHLIYHEGSLIITFFLVCTSLAANYGGNRESLDYIVDDTSKLFGFYFGKQYSITNLIKDSREFEEKINKNIIKGQPERPLVDYSADLSKIKFGIKIACVLFIIAIYILASLVFNYI